MVTFQIANMEKSGLNKEQYENPEYLAEYICDLWKNSGKGRKAGVAVCVSLKGLYHAHIACYGNTTTLKKVSDTFFQAHTEPQLGGKTELRAYLLKDGKYAEKGEQVLCHKGLDNIEDIQGKRSDLDEIETLLDSGASPDEIFEASFRYRRYERMIRNHYISKRIKDAPEIQTVEFQIHTGKAGTGKTHVLQDIIREYGSDSVYVLNDFDNNASGGLDGYMRSGAPPILFIDDFKGEGISYGKLLTMLNGYKKMQTHCRFENAQNLWSKLVLTTIYSPEELYKIMVPEEKRNKDSYLQLFRRITSVHYHYINKNNEYKEFWLPACQYTSLEDMVERANEYEKYSTQLEALNNTEYNDLSLTDVLKSMGAVEVSEK